MIKSFREFITEGKVKSYVSKVDILKGYDNEADLFKAMKKYKVDITEAPRVPIGSGEYILSGDPKNIKKVILDHLIDYSDDDSLKDDFPELF